MEQREHWSYSQLNCLMQCPLLYLFRYILRREPEFTPDYFPFGTALHEAHRSAYLALKEGRKLEEIELQRVFGESWEILGADPTLRYGKRDWGELLNLGLSMLKVFLEKMPMENVVEVDFPFTVPLISSRGEILERPLTGVFDLVTETDDGTIVVVDFKTGSKKYKQEDVDADLQASCYCYAIEHSFEGFGKTSFRFDLVTKTKKPAFVSYPTERTEKHFQRMVNLFSQAEQEIAHGVFLPRPSWRCSSCSHRGACSEWVPDEREAELILSKK
jgi:putative RecB family exonuclease